ncbi:hypothetical protein SAMN05421788_102471 [Filimonas lacunae]|uniref:Uncharacterized protein n=1 Tax=Filimonas lacunae TaxID=477680 RepID=A0A1N7NIM7_9BACT|nr:hypothetical protein [Filimonas lacunae]SIS98194.1 hypothetical protein SAMN05421788_102471 [Filimonas lacunae]
MAKYVCENPPAPGMYGKLQVYIREGITLGRIPSPLCRKRVKTAPEFAKTRKYAELLATASPLASEVHKMLPVNRERKHYQLLAGKAIQWLKEGRTVEEVRVLLVEAGEMVRRELEPKNIKTSLRRRITCRKSSMHIHLKIDSAVRKRPIKQHILLYDIFSIRYFVHKPTLVPL